AARELHVGEKAYKASGCERITAPDGGRIHFRIYGSVVHGGACRGLSVDRVYVDHSDLHASLAPCLLLAPDGLANVVHC
ncbi:hypothetical protein, partial [Nocardia sp. NPDC057455]|uniref:hypothetical protein n=1 Tax=Nocardia sp. NPDC057455 TaxID=3346138 RepID=UPI0036706D8A